MSSSSSSGGAYGPINDITPGFLYLAVARLGDNATSGSVWEFCVGADTTTHCSTGDRVWGSNPTHVIDSGWVDVSLTVATGDSASDGALTVADDGVDYPQGPYSNISSVQIQASAVGVNGATALRSISAVFKRDDSSTETVVVDQNTNPNAINSSGSGAVKQAIEIRPSSNNFVSVTVQMQMKISSVATTLPAADSLVAGIYIFTE